MIVTTLTQLKRQVHWPYPHLCEFLWLSYASFQRWLIDAPVAVRRARLCGLRGLSTEDADRMIATQQPSERKRKKSQYVIDNDGTLEELERRARSVYDDLERRATAKEQA